MNTHTNTAQPSAYRVSIGDDDQRGTWHDTLADAMEAALERSSSSWTGKAIVKARNGAFIARCDNGQTTRVVRLP